MKMSFFTSCCLFIENPKEVRDKPIIILVQRSGVLNTAVWKTQPCTPAPYTSALVTTGVQLLSNFTSSNPSSFSGASITVKGV
jgi:hypothetical protein